MLIITTAFISGCGKPSMEEAYDYVSKVPLSTSYDDVTDKIGEETETLAKGVSATGKLTGLTGRWRFEDKADKDGLNQDWFELYFNDRGLGEVQVSITLIEKIAKKRNHFCDLEFVENAGYIIQGDVKYNGLTYEKLVELLGKEGLVQYRCRRTIEKNHPHTTYVWYDRNGSSILITFPRK